MRPIVLNRLVCGLILCCICTIRLEAGDGPSTNETKFIRIKNLNHGYRDLRSQLRIVFDQGDIRVQAFAAGMAGNEF